MRQVRQLVQVRPREQEVVVRVELPELAVEHVEVLVGEVVVDHVDVLLNVHGVEGVEEVRAPQLPRVDAAPRRRVEDVEDARDDGARVLFLELWGGLEEGEARVEGLRGEGREAV